MRRTIVSLIVLIRVTGLCGCIWSSRGWSLALQRLWLCLRLRQCVLYIEQISQLITMRLRVRICGWSCSFTGCRWRCRCLSLRTLWTAKQSTIVVEAKVQTAQMDAQLAWRFTYTKSTAHSFTIYASIKAIPTQVELFVNISRSSATRWRRVPSRHSIRNWYASDINGIGQCICICMTHWSTVLNKLSLLISGFSVFFKSFKQVPNWHVTLTSDCVKLWNLKKKKSDKDDFDERPEFDYQAMEWGWKENYQKHFRKKRILRHVVSTK